MLNDAEFAIIAREVKQRSGAVLTREMAGAIEMRLQPLSRREGFSSVSELISAARIRPDGNLWAGVADHLVQSDTRFFRDRVQFDLLRTTLLPEALKRRGHERVRVWSAACSTGQEAYSVAIIVEEMRAEGVNAAVELIATDLSDRLLDKARSGLYTQFEVQRGLPIRKLIGHFEKAGDLWRITDRMRAAVKFEQHNLLKHPGHLGQFDIILLGHTLSAFDAETRAEVLERVSETLAPEGVIVLGPGETVPQGFALLACENGIARRAGAKRAAA